MTNVAMVLYDTVSKGFGPVRFYRSIGEAVRTIEGTIKKFPDDLVAQYPHHYEAFTIGGYDDETATLIPGEKTSLGMVSTLIGLPGAINQ